MKNIRSEHIEHVMGNIKSEENFDELVKYLEMPYDLSETKERFLLYLKVWLKDEKMKAIAHLLFHLKRFQLTKYVEK